MWGSRRNLNRRSTGSVNDLIDRVPVDRSECEFALRGRTGAASGPMRRGLPYDGGEARAPRVDTMKLTALLLTTVAVIASAGPVDRAEGLADKYVAAIERTDDHQEERATAAAHNALTDLRTKVANEQATRQNHDIALLDSMIYAQNYLQHSVLAAFGNKPPTAR